MAAIYDWRDEREGVWTEIVEGPEYTLIRLRHSLVASVIVGVIFVLLLVLSFAQLALVQPAGFGREISLSVILAGGAIILAILRRKKSLKHSFPIVIAKADQSIPETEGRVIDSAEIEAVEARENTGKRSDDSRMFQVYLHLCGNEKAELIYQDYFNRRESVKEIAERLATRWNLALVKN